MGITEPLDPLKCYCGKPTKIYDSLFKRNFCSEECSNDLMHFLGGCDKSISICKEIRAGDFNIRGGVVTLHPTLSEHQERKSRTIDEIDAKIGEDLARDKERAEKRRELKRIGIADSVIEAMLNAGYK